MREIEPKSSDEVESEGRKLRPQVEKFMKDYWGDRCDEFLSDCDCCKAWACFDDIFAYLDDDANEESET